MTSRKDRAVRAWSAFSDSRRQTPVDDSIGYTVSLRLEARGFLESLDDWQVTGSCLVFIWPRSLL